ncbi:phage minor capsid protein [Streptomyces shenzhenensis]|uniref:Phage capsid protein n=1 Tax=Streptomyces shenzhenensis TaxID=943815 RepID=A0A3M0I4M2_9ACTN|nr:phage minor capsid protein [Streptomyces shenzhenensis]RMB83714.1 phage capsid protein [Streptomyces shenzhenensis]
MPIHPGMVEDLAAGTRDLYAQTEERLLGIIARQLAAGLDAPGWAERKLAAVQALRAASQAVVDEAGKAVTLDVFEAVAEAYNTGHRAAVAELGALSDDGRRLVDDVTPNAQAVDRLAEQTATLLTDRHRSILRTVEDGYRDVVAQVTATPLLGTGTRRHATQDAMRAWADRGITSFTDRAGRRWQLTSYAEMAVRTSVGRAATEAHARTLTDAGIDLVIVSDAPRECPLCRPWEGKVLSLAGPDGRHTVDVEHAIEDGRMVRVDVAGSLDEARRAGFQHPNCRHSTSAYTPGITRLETPDSDPSGYEAGQRQREIERHIRRYKNRAAAAVDPEAKRQANAKVRQWQGAMRDHLDAHPGLRRLRHREQPGASNLPEPRRPATPEQVDAARVWSGDDRSVRAMTDDQLAAAERSGLLDQRARDRIAAEADRRDLDDLLDRAVPGGRLADDLTGFSDDELGRLLAHADTSDALRIAGELDRRDLAARLPDVRTDLVHLSDDQLAARVREAIEHGTDDVSVLAAEAHRRDLLAAYFPNGTLAADLSQVGDDALAWCMQYANDEELLRIATEMDRRDAVPLPPPAATGDAVADLLADRDALADAMGNAPDPEGWGALADDAAWAQELAAAIAADAARGVTAETARQVTRAEARAMYDEYVYRQMLAAEHDLNGYLLNKKAQVAGHNPISLFSGPARIAYARASDELKEWWATHGRLTQAEFIEKATGQTQRWAAGARKAESDHQNKR